jgi:hypothetical protein
VAWLTTKFGNGDEGFEGVGLEFVVGTEVTQRFTEKKTRTTEKKLKLLCGSRL